MYLNIFYSKIPDPWGSAFIRDYPFVNSDTLGRRISFLKERLSEWCHQAYLIKKEKMIRKENVLCCRGILSSASILKPWAENHGRKFCGRLLLSNLLALCRNLLLLLILLGDSCHIRVIQNQQYLYSKFPPTAVVKLLQYSGSRVELRDGFSSYE